MFKPGSLLLALSLSFPLSTALAQDNETPASIVNEIEKSGIITVEQPAGLAGRLIIPRVGDSYRPEATRQPNSQEQVNASDNSAEAETAPVAGTVKTAGYRVQVFSDNNARTAKSEARSKAQALQARLPHYRTYVVYQSPYWRLKVGDFPTMTEAENAAEEIRKLFPSFSREVRVVKDRINRQ